MSRPLRGGCGSLRAVGEPRKAAAVALFRRAGPTDEVEVYLVRRNRRLPFLGGFHVFPGGTLDLADSEVVVVEPPVAAAFCSTAIRELFEETGVLLADLQGRTMAAERDTWRRQLLRGAVTWPHLLSDARLTLLGPSLNPIGQWLTPPYSRTIFHAHYFAAFLPDGQSPEVWPGELEDGLWLTPDRAIHAHRTGQLFIAYPVLETLKVFAAHGPDLTAACAALDRRDGLYPHPGGELIAGIHIVPGRTPTLPPATHTNTYILGSSELVIIDPATPEPEDQTRLLSYLSLLQKRGGRFREVWLTHHHQDHIGAVERIRRELGLGVAAHPLTAAALAGRILIDRQIQDGEVTPLPREAGPDAEWVALHTPGHAPGHLCFYERQLGSILTGDLVLSVSTVVVAPPEGNMIAYLASLRRLRALRLGFLFPAHGPPIATASEKLDDYLAHRAAREAAILAELTVPRTPAALVPLVYVDVDPSTYPLAELNIRAHLEKLQIEQRVVEAGGLFTRAAG
jgi:endoribonuclease LACTB2